jgi:hypothetical protein
MELIADFLLIAGAASAAFYCFVLSRRLRKFTDLETGVGGAVASLALQVEDLTKAVETAQNSAGFSTEKLAQDTAKAEQIAKRLELLLASMHDLPEPKQTHQEPVNPFYARRGGAS